MNKPPHKKLLNDTECQTVRQISKPITRLQNFRLVQTETNCKQHFKGYSTFKLKNKRQIG